MRVRGVTRGEDRVDIGGEVLLGATTGVAPRASMAIR